MLESTLEALICLSVAILFGVVLGWYLTNIMKKQESFIELDVLQKQYEEKEEQVRKLKGDYLTQKTNLERLTDEGIVCRHQLLQQSNFLTRKSDELAKVQQKFTEVKQIEKERNGLEHTVHELNVQLREKEQELQEFEKVLLKVDSAMHDDSYRQTFREDQKFQVMQENIELLESEIQRLKRLADSKERVITALSKELKLLKENQADWDSTKEDHILISKDQFLSIEERLAEYTSRVKKLEDENIKLSQTYILSSKSHTRNIASKISTMFRNSKNSLTQKLFISSQKKAAKT